MMVHPKYNYLKRFKIETSTLAKRFSFISEASGSKVLAATTDQQSMLEYDYRPAKSRKKAKKTNRSKIAGGGKRMESQRQQTVSS